jgi:hypothetical protein
LLGVQFWPRVEYSLCSSTATYNELENALQKQYYQILPLGGIIRTAPQDSRMINAGFFCPGLPHPGMEALIAMTNKLLMHFGCSFALGDFMKTSYGYLTLELGVSFQPLQASYKRFLFLATHSWMKMLWEKVDRFGVTVETVKGPLAFPRDGDRFLRLVLMERGYSRETVHWLNRVGIHMQVLFLLDVLTAWGNRIDSAAICQRPPTTWMSMLNWPKEEPMAEDMILWRDALEDICPSRCRLNCLGQYAAKSHQIWEWRWCADTNELLQYPQESEETIIYQNKTKKLNRYTEFAAAHRVTQGDICLVNEVQPGVFRITSTAQEAQEPPCLATFVEVLREWGCS